MTASTHVSPYEQRIALVVGALTRNSKIDEKTAAELAVHVLHAVDRIPEKVR